MEFGFKPTRAPDQKWPDRLQQTNEAHQLQKPRSNFLLVIGMVFLTENGTANSLQSWPAWLQSQTLATTAIPPLHELLSDYQPTRQLNSGHHMFSKPAITSYFASCAFATAVPSVWNSLEPDLRSAPSLASFKSRVKTTLFSAAV